MKCAIFLLPLLLVSVACNRYERRTYDVTVINNSLGPITVGLTKNGPPFDGDWAAPEDVAVMNHRDSEAAWGLRLESGKRGQNKRVDARFAPQTLAVLRVYIGELTMDDILAASASAPNRRDVRLREGVSVVTVNETRGKVTIDVSRPAPAQAAPQVKE